MPQRFHALGHNEENICHRRFRNFAIIAPGTVAGIVPWWISRWKIQAPFLHFYGFRVIGVLFILLGLLVLLDSFARFALQGLGTSAPPFATRHLVVTALYRYVRDL